jgi:DNA processing protein
MPTEVEYQVALTLTPHIGCVAAKALIQQFGNAGDIFKAKESELSRIENIGSIRAASIKSFNDFERCQNEIAFAEKNQIELLFLTSDSYPKRLLHCYDPPTLLYRQGSVNLNHEKVAAVVGTRKNTEYGKQVVSDLMESLAAQRVMILSGLAFGIDTLAHREALKNNLPTVSILAHGLHTLYPPENKKLSRQILENGGGLLTEFTSLDQPDKHNFPTRNRVVAGMADVTIVVETDVKGGSMITAELANNYNRDVLAFPGRTCDPKSRGCNRLIRTNKAALVENGEDVLAFMNWQAVKKKQRVQRSLFIELSADEKLVFDLLNLEEVMHIDDIHLRTQLSASRVAAALLSLELQGVLLSLPGKMYRPA